MHVDAIVRILYILQEIFDDDHMRLVVDISIAALQNRLRRRSVAGKDNVVKENAGEGVDDDRRHSVRGGGGRGGGKKSILSLHFSFSCSWWLLFIRVDGHVDDLDRMNAGIAMDTLLLFFCSIVEGIFYRPNVLDGPTLNRLPRGSVK